ncbi:MAG: TonB-dependent receptor, partial [Bacteroidota bacterium]
MKVFLHIILLICLLKAQLVEAQSTLTDTTFKLQEVVVVAPRLSQSLSGLQSTRFDSLQKQSYYQRNLSDLLSDQSPLFVRTYGLGALATTAFRGGSANHTAVLWNGISLSSPMNGQLDLSLVPVAAADELFIQHGAGSALFGSGAVAGVIHLLSQPQFNRGVTTKLHTSFGSFSDFRQNISHEISKEKWVSSFQLFNATAQNDFPFTNEFVGDNNRRRQTHANLKNRGIINENKWLLGKHHTLSLNTWLQTTDRNLPPTFLQQQSLANQADNALRLNAGWNYSKGKISTFVRTGYLNEQLVFTDELADLRSISRTQQLISEAETKIRFNPNHDINFGLHHTFATASNENFEQNPNQNRTALFAAYQHHSKNQKLHARLAGRAELVGQDLVPFTFSVGGDYQLFKWLIAKATVSKVYRIPTFNDLYWTPGGNPNLLPESGYAQEAGISVRLQNKALRFTSDLSLFNRNIDNWIIWLPGFSYWSPQNIM